MDYPTARLMYGKISIWMPLLLLAASSVDSQELICHPKRMDIVFVLDGSSSVRPWHFKSTKDAVKSMVDEFKSIGPDTVQIGLMQYGSLVKQEFDLNQYQTKEEVNEAIDNVEYMARGTMTGAALKYLITYTFNELHGARSGEDVEKVAVFITDGRAQDPRSVAIWHERVKNAGIEVYVIGVGVRISDADLRLLASEPKDKHLFHVRNFQSIQSIHVTLEDDICVAEINECLNGTHNCDQICTNTVGSFECSCKDGFKLEVDGHSCKPLPPTPPTNLQISDITHTSARVSWTLGNPNGTSNVEYYTVTYQPTDGSSPAKSARVTETETVLKDLSPGTKYNVSVISHGNGLQSAPLRGNVTTLFLGKTTVTVSNPTLTTLHAEWTPAGGDLLTGYSIRVHEVSAVPGHHKTKPVKHASRNVKQDVHNMTITGLDPGSTYKVIVIPKHAKLLGEKGSDIGTTLKLLPPKVSIPKTTFTTALVTWTTIGARADNFTVRLSPTAPTDGSGEQIITTNGTAHSTVFHGLKPGNEYQAVVSGSVTEGGKTFVSGEGNSTNTTLSLIAPNVKIATTSTSATVKWDGVGAEAKMFTVRLTRTDVPDGAEKVAMVVGNLKSKVFTGLIPGATYMATVIGHVIDDGMELLSPEGTANGTTASMMAPNVTIPETTIGSVTVTWSGIGPKADKYRVYLEPANKEDKSAKLNITVTGDVQMTIFKQRQPDTIYTATVVGYLKDAKSPPGSATETTLPLPNPKVTIPATSFTTVNATWSWPVTGDILNFVVTLDGEQSSNPDKTQRVETEADVLNTTFTKLVPGQLYNVKVVGNVLDKGGIFSASATVTGQTLSLLPPNVTVPKTTFTTATVHWSGIGTDAKRFVVKLTPTDSDGETKVINTTGAAHSTVFTGLTPGTKYTATVAGIVDDGTLELSSPTGTAEGTTLSLVAPNVQIAATTTTAKVSWDGVGADAKLFSVHLTRTDLPDGAEQEKSVPGDLNSVRFTDLVPGATYTATVVGHVIDNGTELHSPEGTATGTTTPLAAPNVVITETTIGSATVEWDGVGTMADKFVVSLSPSNATDSSKKTNVTVNGNTLTTLFVKLQPATEYVATVVGYVDDVASPPGTASGTTLPLPHPVISISETSFTTLRTNWTWEVSGDIMNFAVILYRGSYSNPTEKLTTETKGNVFNATFTGLTPGQLYNAVVTGNVSDKGGIFGASGYTRGNTLNLLAPNVTIPKTTFTTAQVDWTGIGADAERFEVHLSRTDAPNGDEEKFIMTGGDFRTASFTGLTPGATYTATVTGFVNDNGADLASPVGEAKGTTLNLFAPNVTIPKTTFTTAQVDWTGIGADAKRFEVHLSRADALEGGEEKFIATKGDVRTTTFTGLTPGATYTATVTGYVDDDGIDLASPVGEAKGTTFYIIAPVVTIPETTYTTARVEWSGIGAEPLRFEISLEPVDGGDRKVTTSSGSMRTVAFIGLMPGTKYTSNVTGFVQDGKNELASPVGSADGTTLSLIAPVVTIPNTTFTTATVQWTDIGAPAKGFQVTLTSSEDTDGLVQVIGTDGDNRTAIFTGLKPGTTYNASVVGVVDDAGADFYSPEGTGNGKTMNLLAPNVTIPSTTFTTAQVDWTGIGADAERFEVHLSRVDALDEGEEKFIMTGGDVRTASFTGLTQEATYTATVTGFVNDNGADLASPVGEAKGTTLNIIAPVVSIPETTYTTARVEWSGIGAEPLRFEISLEPVDGGDRKVTTSSGSMRTVAFIGLMPGTKYTSNVTGFVQDGKNELASPVGSADGTTLSLIAPVVTIPNTTFTTATVQWTDIGAPAKGFQVTLTSSEDTDGLVQVIETDGDNRTAIFTGLKPGTTYNASVVGVVDDAGADFYSPEGTGNGKTKIPPTPIIDVTDTGLSIMDVMWSIPGDPPKEFELKYFPTNKPNETQTLTTDDLSLRLRNLTPSTEYTIKVKAVYIDRGEKVKSPDASTTGTTKNLIAPDVKVLDTSYRNGKIQWTGVGMPVHHWIIRTKVLNGTGPGSLREDNMTQLPGELVANLANLEELNEAEVIGVVVEDGKEFESPMGSTVITLDPVPPPHVNVTNTSLTTLDASWEDDIVPDQFVIRISKGMPFKLQSLEQYMEYAPSDDTETVNGEILSNTFTKLTPGTEYVVSVWAKVIEGTQEILSLSGLANGATRPLPPENLKLEETPSTTLSITFNPPSQGDASAFEVKCVPKGTNPSTITKIDVPNDPVESTKTTTCDNLKPGVTYEVYARTMLQSVEEPPQALQPEDYNMNKQSYGPYYSDYIKASETIEVGPVNDFMLTQPTTHSLLATWQPPDNVEQVEHYILTYKAADSVKDPTELVIPGNETSKILSILHPDTLYEADILPVVNSVSGPKGDDSEKTLKDNVSIQVVDTNFTSIRLEWPISKVPGARYRIYWSPRKQKSHGSEQEPPDFIDIAPGQSATSLNNLMPATMYDISIDYVYQTTPLGQADTVGSTGLPPPGPINFTDVDDTSFVAHWGKPDFDAQPIGYHVTYTGPDGIPVSVDVVGPDTLQLEIDDAQPGSLYDFKVAADYGDMGLSEDVTAKVKTDEPICSCATYVRRQQQMEKTVGKLVDIITDLQKKIDDLHAFITLQSPTKLGNDEAATSLELDDNSPW